MERLRQAIDEAANGNGTVAVVIPCYNHARFLDDALKSVLAQTRPANEIVVVDDGSTDDPASVVAKYPEVLLIRQDNAGLAAARNTGLLACSSEKIAFLDADDALEPDALALNLELFSQHPDAGFVYGAYFYTDGELRRTSGPQFRAVNSDASLDMLVGNPVAMHATVLYDRQRLLDAGAFDPSVKVAEDYDAYIRLARRHPVACHPHEIAAYRIHTSNMSADRIAMLRGVIKVLDRYKPADSDLAARARWNEAKRFWQKHYSQLAIAERNQHGSMGSKVQVLRAMWHAPRPTVGKALRTFKSRVRGLAREVTRSARRSPLARIDMGSFRTTEPVSRWFGFDRGTPVDRYYIENFLDRHGADIRGRVLEVGDDSYSRRFGQGITQQDVLHISPDAPQATIVGDLSKPDLLPRDAFDCMVITQTLHLVFDMMAAVRQLHDALKPGGVLLLTAPYITPIDPDEWNAQWFWAMSGQAATRMFGEIFGAENISVEVHGNVHVATCFLQGMAMEEVDRKLLDVVDPCYPVIVAVRAQRAA